MTAPILHVLFTNDEQTSFVLDGISPRTRAYHCYSASKMSLWDRILNATIGRFCTRFSTQSVKVSFKKIGGSIPGEETVIPVFMRCNEIFRFQEEARVQRQHGTRMPEQLQPVKLGAGLIVIPEPTAQSPTVKLPDISLGQPTTQQVEPVKTMVSLQRIPSPSLQGFDQGSATVLFNGERKQIVILSRKGKFHRIFTAYDEESGKKTELGYLQFQRMHIKKNRAYGSQNFPEIQAGPLLYYGCSERVTKIFVDLIKSFENKRYKGVGTALMQAVMEYGYSKGCEGRIEAEASWTSHQFYYKLGMRSTQEEINEGLKKLVTKDLRAITSGLGAGNMYMPEDGIKAWRQKIQENPIFHCAESLSFQPLVTNAVGGE